MKRVSQKWIALVLVGIAVAAGSADAHAGGVGPKLAGVWETVGTPDPNTCLPPPSTAPFVNVSTIGLDGTVTNVDPDVGTGVGGAYRVRGKRYVLGFFGFLSPAPGVLLRYEVQGRLKLVNRGHFVGRFRTIFSDPNGIGPDCVFEGTIEGHRLVPMPY